MTNQIIQNKNFVIQLFVIVDDLLKLINRFSLISANNKVGRKSTFSDAEIIVLILLRWKTSSTSWKSFCHEIYPYYYPLLKKQVKYQNFIESVHRVSFLLPKIMQFLNFLAIGESKSLFYIDSAPIEVCRIKRASSNKVCKGIASRKKSSMGWFYGFKLHAICNHQNQIVAVKITTGSVDDRSPVKELVKDLQGTIYADAGYIGEQLRKTLAESGVKLMAAPRKNMNKLMSFIEHTMLKSRQKIEQVFSVIETRLGLNCALARSINGVFILLVSAITWYQIKTTII